MGPQAEVGPIQAWAGTRRGLSLRTLVFLRWIALAGQTAAVLYVHFGLGFSFAWQACLVVIGLGAWMNASTALALPGRVTGRHEALFQLGFDIGELALVLGLTGGLANPFTLLLIAPATVAAATLPVRNAAILVAATLACLATLAVYHARLPWDGVGLELPRLYLLSIWTATSMGVLFIAAYAYQGAAEAKRMELALAATQAVLAREQRMSALGGLAAAAAHELGTPLATIQVVTKEMLREPSLSDQTREDVDLLMQQAVRCREILKKLSAKPDTSDVHHLRMSLSQLIDEVTEPYKSGAILFNAKVTCEKGADILEVRRQPEVLHGLSAFVENAADFAESSVEVTAHYDSKKLTLEVRDDGPGFSPEVMAKLGEPYTTTRSHGEGSRTGHQGMGLGFFIAKTLLERTGGDVEFRNARRGGALICVSWPRARMEAVDQV